MASAELRRNPVERTLPNDPLSFIEECLRARRIVWTYHVNMRLERRFIRRDAIATDVDGKNVRVVTAYRPSRAVWDDNWKTGRVPE